MPGGIFKNAINIYGAVTGIKQPGVGKYHITFTNNLTSGIGCITGTSILQPAVCPYPNGIITDDGDDGGAGFIKRVILGKRKIG